MKNIFIIFVVVAFLLLGWLYQASVKPNLGTAEYLENFLVKNRASDEVAEAYRFALENPKGVLSKVKCYCGCLKNQKHTNNRECFIKRNGEIDLMGLNCGLCIKTALISKQMLAEGKTVDEISQYVNNRWGRE